MTRISTFRRAAIKAAALALAAFAAPAPAAEPADRTFKDLFLLGCLPATVTGGTITLYAAAIRLDPAPPALVAELTADRRSATAFMKQDGRDVALILQRPDGSCSVAARRAQDPAALIGEIEALISAQGPFTRTWQEESTSPLGARKMRRSYAGAFKDRQFTVVITASSDAAAPAQAIVTIAPQPAPR